MKKLALAVAVAALTAAASVAMADPGGYGYGPGCGAAGGAVAGAACPGGGGAGNVPGPGFGPRYGRGGGQGMALLTPEERTQFRDAMHAVKTLDECNAVMTQHQQLLQERAKEKGVAAPAGPRGNMCERMKARGLIG